MNFVRILSPDSSSFPHPWISLMSHDSELEELHTMMGGWLSGLSVALWWFGIGCCPLFLFLVLGTIVCSFVCFFKFFIFAKVATSFLDERTHFFLTLSPQKTPKIANDSPLKQIPACYMPGLEFPCVGNLQTIYDLSCSKLFAQVQQMFLLLSFFLISQKQKIFDLKYTFFKVFPRN